jgi:hypothetical protein
MAKQITVSDALRIAGVIFGVGLVSRAIYSHGWKVVGLILKKTSKDKFARFMVGHLNAETKKKGALDADYKDLKQKATDAAAAVNMSLVFSSNNVFKLESGRFQDNFFDFIN